MEFYHVKEVWQQALVYEIRKKTFVEGQQIPIQQEFDELYGQTYHYVLLVNEDQGVATARIKLLSDVKAKIERVAVTPEYKGQGYGRILLEAAEKWLSKTGVETIIIMSQKKARGFYEALGYQTNEQMKIDSAIPQVYTEKRIKRG